MRWVTTGLNNEMTWSHSCNGSSCKFCLHARSWAKEHKMRRLSLKGSKGERLCIGNVLSREGFLSHNNERYNWDDVKKNASFMKKAKTTAEMMFGHLVDFDEMLER